jgi:hypothetical protein
VDVVYEQEIENKEVKGDYRAGVDIGLDELLSDQRKKVFSTCVINAT